MKMTKDEWISWLKCNVLEIAILVLVLVLVVKAFSAPAVGVSEVPALAVVEEPVVSEETSVEEAPVVVEVPVEVPLEEPATAGEVPVKEALTE